VVLDDPVEDDREPALVAARERMRIVLVDCAMRGPARVSETRGRDRSVRTGGALEIGEVADGADIFEPVALEQGDAGGVVAAKLEPLEAGDQQVLRRAAPDVSDDPAHP